ncbi:MAG: hypothetical protein ACO331_08185 [Prochlorothrix sp.]
MAQQDQVRAYLACWFQLGKGVVLHRTGEVLCPCPVLQGNRYSPEFEQCWQQLAHQDSYLEGTCQSISQLLSGSWELVHCPRCSLLVPMPCGFTLDTSCPCHDVPSWPNMLIPQPRAPINMRQHLQLIHTRIQDADRRYQQNTPESASEADRSAS